MKYFSFLCASLCAAKALFATPPSIPDLERFKLTTEERGLWDNFLSEPPVALRKNLTMVRNNPHMDPEERKKLEKANLDAIENKKAAKLLYEKLLSVLDDCGQQRNFKELFDGTCQLMAIVQYGNVYVELAQMVRQDDSLHVSFREKTLKLIECYKKIHSSMMWRAIQREVIPYQQFYYFSPFSGVKPWRVFFALNEGGCFESCPYFKRSGEFLLAESLGERCVEGEVSKGYSFFLFSSPNNDTWDLIKDNGYFFRLWPYQEQQFQHMTHSLHIMPYDGEGAYQPFCKDNKNLLQHFNREEALSHPLFSYLVDFQHSSSERYRSLGWDDKEVGLFWPTSFVDKEEESFFALLFLEELKSIAQKDEDGVESGAQAVSRVLSLLNAPHQEALEEAIDNEHSAFLLLAEDAAASSAFPVTPLEGRAAQKASEEGLEVSSKGPEVRSEDGAVSPEESLMIQESASLDELTSFAEEEARRRMLNRLAKEEKRTQAEKAQEGAAAKAPEASGKRSKKGKKQQQRQKQPQEEARSNSGMAAQACDAGESSSFKGFSLENEDEVDIDALFKNNPRFQKDFEDLKEKKRVKWRHVLSILGRVARSQEGAAVLDPKVIRQSTKGSHYNLHIAGGKGETLVKPHKRHKDHTVPLSRISDILKSVAQSFFIQA